MVEETPIELPKAVKPWVNLITFVGLPLVLLGAILVTGYLGVYRLSAWIAPKAEAFIQEHRDLTDSLQESNRKITDSNEQHARNNAALIEVQNKQTLIMGSIDEHLTTTDARLKHIEEMGETANQRPPNAKN